MIFGTPLFTGIGGGFGGGVDAFMNLSRFISVFSMFQILSHGNIASRAAPFLAKDFLHRTPFAFVIFAQVIMERSSQFGENLPNFLLNPVHDQS
jgi:hypothetical protein